MKDKEFSEQFQNLSKVWRYVVKSSKNDKYAKGNGFKQIAHTEKQIMKHCIDKQKVKEVFRKVHRLYSKFSKIIDGDLKEINKSTGSKFHADLDELEKELRLDK